MKELTNTFFLKSIGFLLKRIVRDISIEAVTRNQTEVVFQSLIRNTAFVLWYAEDGCLFRKLGSLVLWANGPPHPHPQFQK